MNLKRKATLLATTASLLGVAGTAHAALQGRDATGAPSTTCTATGAGKCTYFYDTTLDITILNNWSIGQGFWSASAAPGSAQALAASAGLTASGLTGWVLPTGDGLVPAGAQNQYEGLFVSAGGNLAVQFDGVQPDAYWSSSGFPLRPDESWYYAAAIGQSIASQALPFFAVAVRPGDVAAAIPEPQTYALMLMGVGAVLLAKRRRPL